MAQTLVITDVTVINPRQNLTLPHRTVVVEGERIRSVTQSTAKVPRVLA